MGPLNAYLFDACLNRCIEEFKRVTGVPLAVALNEIMFEHVPRNRCHREVRIGVRVSKVKVLVILTWAITLSGVNRVSDGGQT